MQNKKNLLDLDSLISTSSSEIENIEQEIIKNQATINIGTIGHVAHGKSTVVRSISGVKTVRFRNELERNITIKLGYANAKIFKCRCERPRCFKSGGSDSKPEICDNCGYMSKLVRHVSFVDCPGHDVLMATMLSGTAIMDMAMLLVAANENVPQPQTKEHLMAVEIMKLDKFIIVQNKVDLISREQALEQKDQIVKFLSNTKAIDSPIIPASGQMGINMDAILDYIVQFTSDGSDDDFLDEKIKKIKPRDRNKPPKMIIIRSFDVNKPGASFEILKGGVIGGSLIQGTLKIGDEIEIRPGIVIKKGDSFVCKPLKTIVKSLQTENNKLKVAYPGGLIGVGTTMDPLYCKADKLIGQVMGTKHLPSIFIELKVEYTLFQMFEIEDTDQILLNIGSTTTGAKINILKRDEAYFTLLKPACCEIGENIAISKKINNHWRLIGHGKIKNGKCIEPSYLPVTADEIEQYFKSELYETD